MDNDELEAILDLVEKLERSDGRVSRTVVNPDKGTAGSYHISRNKALDVIDFKHVLPENLQQQIAWAEGLLKQTRRTRLPIISISGGVEGYQNPEVMKEQVPTFALRNHVIANPEDEKNLAKAVILVNNDKLGKRYERDVKGKKVTYEAVDTSKLTTRQRKFLATYLYNSDVNQPLLRRNLNHLIRIQNGPAAGKQFINPAMNAVIGQMDAVKAGGEVLPGLVNRVARLQDGFGGIDGTNYNFNSGNSGDAENLINTRRQLSLVGYEELQPWYNMMRMLPPPALLAAETAEVAAEAKPAEVAAEAAAAPGDGTFVNRDQVNAMVKFLYGKVDTVSDAVNPRQSLLEQ